jgi:hypothetical protein
VRNYASFILFGVVFMLGYLLLWRA